MVNHILCISYGSVLTKREIYINIQLKNKYEQNNFCSWYNNSISGGIDDVLSGTMFFAGGFGILASGIRSIRNRSDSCFKLLPALERQEKMIPDVFK